MYCLYFNPFGDFFDRCPSICIVFGRHSRLALPYAVPDSD